MTRDNKVIYVNGDSFTEGCELSNHFCHGAFDRYYSLDDVINWGADTQNIQTESVRKIRKFHDEHPELLDGFFDYENEKRWSNQLENLLGRRVLNTSSHGGSGMYAIAYRTLMDISRFIKQGLEVTDVIIQITSPYRFSVFKDTGKFEEPRFVKNTPPPTRYNIVSMNYVTDVPAGEIEDPQWQQYRYIHDLYMFSNAIKQITNANLIFVDSIFYKTNPINKIGINLLDAVPDGHVKDFKNTLDSELTLSMLDVIDRYENDTFTAGLHFTEKVHERFARAIAERYFNE